MRQRYGRNNQAQAYCRLHGNYPLNFSYRGMGFANACPKCYPNWQKQQRDWRDRMLAEHGSEGGDNHG